MRIPILDRSAGLRHGVVQHGLEHGPADLAEMTVRILADLLKPLMTLPGARRPEPWRQGLLHIPPEFPLMNSGRIMNHSSAFMFQVGYPATMSPDDRTVEILRAAILHVADQERRHQSAVSLLLLLPEFVARGRHLEAWLLQGMAYETVEHGQSSNPFLYEMFTYGYDAWAAEKRARNESLVRKLGFNLDELRAMKPGELDAWIRSQGAGPEGERALEAFFNENPQLREESVASLEGLECNSRKLLDREDARFLLIPDEEVQPWLRLLHQRSIEAGWPDPSLGEALSEEDGKRIFEGVALPLMREMANAIFTPDRIRELVADLRKYRGERLSANDLDTAALAMGAICYLEREDDPGLNTFLLSLCGASTDASVQAMCDSPDGASPEAP